MAPEAHNIIPLSSWMNPAFSSNSDNTYKESDNSKRKLLCVSTELWLKKY